MATRTNETLNKETLSGLQELIQANIDSYKGCQEAAEAVVDMSVASMFREIAAQRKRQADELTSIVSQAGVKPEDTGSIAGAAHRVWMDLRNALSGGISAVLSEAERGEDHIKEKYEEVLKATAGSPVTDTLNRQYSEVKRAHDRVRDLRDAHKE